MSNIKKLTQPGVRIGLQAGSSCCVNFESANQIISEQNHLFSYRLLHSKFLAKTSKSM